MLDPCELTEADLHQALMDMLPVGWAWPREPDTTLSRFWRGVADEAHRSQKRACDLLIESNPATTVELLGEWERSLGLPDPCAPPSALLQERRNAVVALLSALGEASVSFFANLAADRGYAVEIREHRPFECGRSRCGDVASRDRVGSQLQRFVWTVALQTPRLSYARCGVATNQCGLTPQLSIERAEEIECLFERLKPSHTEVVFDYTQQVDFVAFAAMVFSAEEGVVTGAGDRVLEWTSGGLAPITMTGASEHITLDNGVIRASAAGAGQLSYDTQETDDLPLGFSAFVVARMPDASVLGTNNRLFTIEVGAASVFNALLPVSPGVVQLETNGGNVTAAGISDADLETYAVWGFVVDQVEGRGRILRNGVTLASASIAPSFVGVSRYRALLNAALDVKGGLLFDRGSPEIDAAATQHLITKHQVET
jgi:uncharacterized protein YmfQ (DUF2313 family)